MSRRIISTFTAALAALACTMTPVASGHALAATTAAVTPLGRRIANTAATEARNPARNHERGSNCNFYSGYLRAGPACGAGWRRVPWCADFARWTWAHAGADTTGLTAWAISFRSYGLRHHTWHPGPALTGVQVGDVIGYRFGGTPANDHVGIVIAVQPLSVTTVDGNVSNRITTRTIPRNTATISGFTQAVTR